MQSDLCYPAAPPIAKGKIKASPEDFVVVEKMGFEPDAVEGHYWYWVQKRGANTQWVADALGKAAQVSARDIGFSGLKDRHAVTQQWFSSPKALPEELEIEGVEVLRRERHSKKLKRGWHRGNHFSINVDLIDIPEAAVLEARVSDLRQFGFANYFGPQRFGRDNLRKFMQLPNKRPRSKDGILLSSARSAMFNHWLDQRIRHTGFEIAIGDRVMLAGTRSHFEVNSTDLDDVKSRAAALDVHLAGPLPGKGSSFAGVGEGAEPMIEKLAAMGVESSWRAARVIPKDLNCSLIDSTLNVEFSLPSGAYATVLLAHIIDLVE